MSIDLGYCHTSSFRKIKIYKQKKEAEASFFDVIIKLQSRITKHY